MECIIPIIAALSFLLVWAGLTRPKPIARPQADRDEQYRLRELRSVGLFRAAVEDLAAWFQGQGTGDTTWRGGLNARYLRWLKQADWYWVEGEQSPPSPKAPFWNLETMWAAKVFHGLLFGLGGLLLGGAACAVFHWPFVVAPVVAAIGGFVGTVDPDNEVSTAAEERRKQIVLEMGYKVPEMRAYVRSGRSFVSAVRYLTSRPGGPFVKELLRALRIYDITSDVERGMRAVMEANPLCQPLVNLCGDLVAVESEGGEIGPVLEAHTESAQHEMRRMLRQQGQINTQQMMYVVAGAMLIVTFILVGGPALWIVITSL
jgi:Flp pilus assembly protein TadB